MRKRIVSQKNVDYIIGIETGFYGSVAILFRDKSLNQLAFLPTPKIKTQRSVRSRESSVKKDIKPTQTVDVKALHKFFSENILPGMRGFVVFQDKADYKNTSHGRFTEGIKTALMFMDYKLIQIKQEAWYNHFIGKQEHSNFVQTREAQSAAYWYISDRFPELQPMFTERKNFNSVLIALYGLENILDNVWEVEEIKYQKKEKRSRL